MLSCGRTIGLMALLLTFTAASLTAQPRRQDPGDAAMAEHLTLLAQSTLRRGPAIPQQLTQAIALLEAATRLNSNEERFARLLADAQLSAGDGPAALAALSHYRRLAPSDVHAQIQSIQLYAAGMNTSEQQVAYLSGLIDKEQIPTEVRAYAATALARLRFERSEVDQAHAMLDKALELNPLDIGALHLALQRELQQEDRSRRVQAMLNVLRANPVQPQISGQLAGELSRAGLSDSASEWYVTSISLYTRLGQTPPLELIRDYIAQLLIIEQYPAAETMSAQLLQVNPNDAQGLILRMLTARQQQNQQMFDDALRQSRIIMQNWLLKLQQDMGDTSVKLLEPAATNLGAGIDPAGLAESVRNSGRADSLEDLRGTLIDTAWLHLYFNDKPAEAAPFIAALKQISAPDDPNVAWLEGWSFLRENKPDEARVKLSAVAGQSFFAALGLLTLDGAGNTEFASLLKENLSGADGAYIAIALRKHDRKWVRADDADRLRMIVREFPQDWLKVIDQPTNFFIVRAEPLQVAHKYAEPMLVRISVQNLGDRDLTIGPDGVIRRDLWFNVQARGALERHFPGAAFDSLRQETILRKGKSISQIVRLDQGELNEFLLLHPPVAIQLFSSITVNPVPAQNGIAAGPAGITLQFPKVLSRSAFPFSNATQQMVNTAMESGTSAEKMRVLLLLGQYARNALAVPADADPESMQRARTFADEMMGRLRSQMGNSDANVSAIAGQLLAELSPAEQRSGLLSQMLQSGELQKQLLALSGARTLPPREQIALSESVAEDADPLVKRFADAVKKVAKNPVTQPATQAATQPARQ